MSVDEPLFAEIDLGEDDNPELTLVLSKLARKAVEWIRKSIVDPIALRVEDARRLFDIRSVDPSPDRFLAILAVDSTWTKPPLELVSCILAVIVSGYIVVAPNYPGFYEITYTAMGRNVAEDESRFSVSIELKSKIMEFCSAAKALRKFPSIIDLILVDGPLYPAFAIPEFYKPKTCVDPFRDSKGIRGRDLAPYLSKAFLRLIEIAREIGEESTIPIVGVVKRVRSRFTVPILLQHGLDDLAKAVMRSNDKTLFSYILRPGEAAYLGTFLDLARSWLNAKDRKTLKILEAACRGDLGEEARELCRAMDDTAVVYYMPRTDLVVPQAIRLDIYPKKAVDDVLRYVMADTSHNAVPTPIDMVDKFVRMEASTIRRFHVIMQQYADEVTSIALGFTNPQKMYLYTSSRQSRSTI